ncbi:MAG: hypothetical protein Q8N63_04210 [Nanoarchaeota archaeon]|nr:hypothetical protein [Nanoarchaeota archaeon]
MGEERENSKTLIEIILYLLLSIAFFSTYAIKSDTIDFRIGVVFLFGILSIFFLYIGLPLKNNYFNGFFKTLGYSLAFSFIWVFSWFIFNVLALGQGDTIREQLRNILKSKAILLGLLIPIVSVLYLIIKNKIYSKKHKNLN